MKRLYIFDFDNTIYSGDSMLDFAKFNNAKRYYFSIFILAFPILTMKLGLVHSTQIKKIFLRINFAGKSYDELEVKSTEFFKINNDKIKKSFTEFLIKIDRKNSDCYIVSASSALWLRPFYESMNCHFIGTELEIENGIITGKLKSANRKGGEKVNAIQDTVQLDLYSEIHCFGDSKSDERLKQIATHYYSNHF